MRQLYVYNNDIKAGVLTEIQPGHGYVFSYDEHYLLSDMPPVSLTLPKRKEPYESDYLFPFFANMLPEGGNRRVICRLAHLDTLDFFGILTDMADKDCIGAVNLRKISHE